MLTRRLSGSFVDPLHQKKASQPLGWHGPAELAHEGTTLVLGGLGELPAGECLARALHASSRQVLTAPAFALALQVAMGSTTTQAGAATTYLADQAKVWGGAAGAAGAADAAELKFAPLKDFLPYEELKGGWVLAWRVGG